MRVDALSNGRGYESWWHNLSKWPGKQQTRMLRICRTDGILFITGHFQNGEHVSHQKLQIHRDCLDELITCLQYIQAGPMGRAAIDAENKTE